MTLFYISCRILAEVTVVGDSYTVRVCVVLFYDACFGRERRASSPILTMQLGLYGVHVWCCTLSVDLVLQELLHRLLFGDVQGRLAFAVHNSYVGALADEIPATTTTTNSTHTNILGSSRDDIYRKQALKIFQSGIIKEVRLYEAFEVTSLRNEEAESACVSGFTSTWHPVQITLMN